MRKYLLHVLIISFVFLLAPVIYAEEPRAIEPVLKNYAIDTERRIALVIGNGNYKSSPLRNTVNDASDISSRLTSMGFAVSKGTNMSRKDMYNAIRAFGNDLKKGGVGLFYYSGHGMQVKGKNYLIPVGVNIQSEDEVEFEAIDAGMVMRKMESAGNTMNMVFLDACRDNPFARSFRTSSQGLAQMDAPSGSLIVYATAPGSVASDGKGRNGIFTKNLLLHLSTPGLEVGKMLRMVRVSVKKDTGGKQVPWESSSLEGEFYFVVGEEIYSDTANDIDSEDAKTEDYERTSEYWLNLGEAYYESGKYEEAIESCKQAIRIDPDDAYAHNNLGLAYAQLGKYEEAIKSYKQAIRIDPDLADPHYNLGLAYGESGKYKEAIESYKQAISIDPDAADAHYGLGLAYVDINDRDSALEQYEILKKLDTELANKLFNEIYK